MTTKYLLQPAHYRDLKALLIDWVSFFNVNISQLKTKLNRKNKLLNPQSNNAESIIDKLYLDISQLIQTKKILVKRESHIQILLCLHLMWLSDYKVCQERSTCRTYSDTGEMIDTRYGRADLVICNRSSNIPEILIELKILSSQDL